MFHLSKVIVLVTAFIGHVTAVSEMYVCASPDASFLGKYSAGNAIDGAPSYVNDNDMAFFRHNGFWYLGDVQQWPPVTHYRCVDFEGCNNGQDHPADNSLEKWAINKRFGKEPIPTISYTPCESNDELTFPERYVKGGDQYMFHNDTRTHLRKRRRHSRYKETK